MPKHTAAGKEATKEEQPFDVAKTTDERRVEVAGGIPIGIFTDEERAERHEQYEKEGRILDPPEMRNPVTESEKLLDQQAQSLAQDREQLKERRAEDAKAAAHTESHKSHK